MEIDGQAARATRRHRHCENFSAQRREDHFGADSVRKMIGRRRKIEKSEDTLRRDILRKNERRTSLYYNATHISLLVTVRVKEVRVVWSADRSQSLGVRRILDKRRWTAHGHAHRGRILNVSPQLIQALNFRQARRRATSALPRYVRFSAIAAAEPMPTSAQAGYPHSNCTRKRCADCRFRLPGRSMRRWWSAPAGVSSRAATAV